MQGGDAVLNNNQATGRLWYGLSARGGEQWEAMAQPGWHQCLMQEEVQGTSPEQAFAEEDDTEAEQQPLPVEDQEDQRRCVQTTSLNRDLVEKSLFLD